MQNLNAKLTPLIADVVYGESGNDKAWGGEGADVMLGGAGDDLLNGDNGFDIVIESEAANDAFAQRKAA